MTDTTRRVLVIGWDAADWKIINALIEQGKMPHTAALIERGFSCSARSFARLACSLACSALSWGEGNSRPSRANQRSQPS